MPESRGRRKPKKSKSRGVAPAKTALEPIVRPSTQRRSHWRSLRQSLATPLGKAIAILLFVLTLVGGFGGIPPLIEAYENLIPEIHPRDTIDGSSLILPFTVRNRSGVFSIKDTTFTCGVDLVYAEDSNGQVILMKDVAFDTGVYSIAPTKSIPYPCNASALLEVRPDGTLSVYGSSTKFVGQDSRPITWHPPFRILKMCIWVSGTCRIVGVIPWPFTSEIDQWPAAPTLHQWIEGPIGPSLRGQDPFANLPRPSHAFSTSRAIAAHGKLLPNALECNETVTYPYMLTKDSGEAYVMFFEPPTWYMRLWRWLVGDISHSN
jgi:hypothetical protein